MKFDQLGNLARLATPQEALPLVLVFAGFLMMFGFRKLALTWVSFVLLTAFFHPFVEPLLTQLAQIGLSILPTWAIALIVVFVVAQVLRFIFELFFGAEAGGNILATTVIGLFCLPFRLLGFLCRRLFA